MLTGRYLHGIPEDSRAARKDSKFLHVADVESKLDQIKALNSIAEKRGQSLAEMALAWDLRQPAVASVIIGASRVSQLDDNVKALNNLNFSEEEEQAIDQILA